MSGIAGREKILSPTKFFKTWYLQLSDVLTFLCNVYGAFLWQECWENEKFMTACVFLSVWEAVFASGSYLHVAAEISYWILIGCTS